MHDQFFWTAFFEGIIFFWDFKFVNVQIFPTIKIYFFFFYCYIGVINTSRGLPEVSFDAVVNTSRGLPEVLFYDAVQDWICRFIITPNKPWNVKVL